MSDCGVCLYSEYDCSVDFCSVQVRTARKPHKCYECDKEIPVGAKYQYAAGKCDGDFWDAHTCLICAEIRKAFYCDGPEMFGEFWNQMDDNDVWERMTTGCLNRLQTPEAKKELLRRWNEWKFDREVPDGN